MNDIDENPNPVTCKLVPEDQRIPVALSLLGPRWALEVEPLCWILAEKLAPAYSGGLWNYIEISNNSMYMAPDETESFLISDSNYFSGSVSPDLFGLIVCLLIYGELRFAGDWEKFPRLCSRHFHLLQQYAMRRPDADIILEALE